MMKTLFIILSVLVNQVVAGVFMYEQEPNNKPLTATIINPPIKILAQMRDADQDLYHWEVSEAQSGYFWELQLQGIREKLTAVDIMQLNFTEDGKSVTSVNKIYSFSSKDGLGIESVSDLLFQAGHYYIGLYYAGSDKPSQGLFSNDSLNGFSQELIDEIKRDAKSNKDNKRAIDSSNYSLEFIKKKQLYFSGKNEPKTRDNPHLIRGYYSGLLYQEKPLWLKFSINDKDSLFKWKLSGHVTLGKKIHAKLYDSQNELLLEVNSNKKGDYQFNDLTLAEGDYLVELSSDDSFFLSSVEFNSVGFVIQGQEKEPNNEFVRANNIKFNNKIIGKMGSNYEYDYYKFTVSESEASHVLGLTIENIDKKNMEVCLLKSTGYSFQCRKKNDDIPFSNLSLVTGDYGIYVRGENDARYAFELKLITKRKPIIEAEPNDNLVDATPMNSKNIIKGNFDVYDEHDYFRFDVNEDKLNWSIQANGSNLLSMTLFNAAGVKVQYGHPDKSGKRIKFSNLNLSVGQYVVDIRGAKGKYLLRAFSTGKVDKNFEREPNNSKHQAMILKYNQIKKGNINSSKDMDYYLFKLSNNENIKLTITPPDDGDIHYYIYHDDKSIASMTSKKGESVFFVGNYPAGEYHVQLSSRSFPSESNYQIKLERLPQSKCLYDCEPNNSLKTANDIPKNWKIRGKTGTQGEYDWYYIKPFAEETKLSFVEVSGNDGGVRVHNGKGEGYNMLSSYEKTGSVRYLSVPAATKTYVEVYGANVDYNFDIMVNDKKSDEQILDDGVLRDIAINITGLPKAIKAFYDYGQNLKGNIDITNNSKQSQQLNITVKTSEYKWNFSIETDNVELTAGSHRIIPFTLKLPSDIYSNTEYFIDVVVSDSEGRITQQSLSIEAITENNAVAPDLYWPIDESFLGGINVASYAMGAKRTKADIKKNTDALGSGFDKLFDGIQAKNAGLLYRGGRKSDSDTITIDLAGEDAKEILGFIINPLSSRAPHFYPKNIVFQLSLDGLKFETVLKTQLKTIGVEQSFKLPKSIKAKYARLILVDSYSGREKEMLVLGEWMVIAKPDAINEVFNIAAPKHGGFVAWALPELSTSWDKELLTEEQEKFNSRSRIDEKWQWVIGFHHQRIALIDKIQWLPAKLTKGEKVFENIKIMASTSSPVGPWIEIAKLTIDHAKTINEIKLPQPVWARYIKFETDFVKKGEYRYPPKTIRVIEHKVDDNHRSILGQWGYNSPQSYYEMTHKINYIQDLDDGMLSNHSKDKSYELKTAQKFNGQVQLENSDKPDWFKYKVPQDQNTLKITLKGEPNVRTIIECQDEKGTEVPLITKKQKNKQIDYIARVDMGKYYYCKVNEPPRSVIFAWDSSGSTSHYHPIIYQALNVYSQGVIPDRDMVNFLPFGSNLLMKEWYDKPIILKSILSNYQRKDDSSSAETALFTASKALENRQGTRAIIMLTDAITPKDVKAWRLLDKVKPQIFSLAIIEGNAFGSDVKWQEDLLQSWSMVNHGDYHVINTAYDVGVAYDRVSERLRQPANYQITMESSFEKVKGSGTLLITQKEINGTNSGAIELILDASGSMLKRINGKRRINIAKEVLSKAVFEIIPQDTPLALRVFGNKQAGSCRTDLAMPLKPLDANKANKIIQSINAKNLAKTPIAASLEKIASDLSANKGKKIVILVTDGEETCNGDPQEVIKKLNNQGIDLRLNIVGFAINDEKLKQQFQSWSSAGGGKYFDSDNSSSLQQSIIQALQTPFSVYSLTDELLAEDFVNGEAVELPAGFYNIKIFGNNVKTIKKYFIEGEKQQKIDYKN